MLHMQLHYSEVSFALDLFKYTGDIYLQIFSVSIFRSNVIFTNLEILAHLRNRLIIIRKKKKNKVQNQFRFRGSEKEQKRIVKIGTPLAVTSANERQRGEVGT